MKKKIAATVLIAAFAAVPAFALFGLEDTVEFGPITMAQAIEEFYQLVNIYQQGEKLYTNVNRAANFIKSPGYWRGVLANEVSGIGGALAQASNGHDLVALQQLTAGNQSAIAAIQQSVNSGDFEATAESSAMLSLLHQSLVEHTQAANALQSQIAMRQVLDIYKQQDPGFQGMQDWKGYMVSR